MIYTFFTTLLFITASTAQTDASIPIKPLTNVDVAHHKGYFSDPYHVPYESSQEIYVSGTTHSYLECSGKTLSPECASSQPMPSNDYISDAAINQTAKNAGVNICGTAGIHPFQSGSDRTRSWDAIVTLHVSDKPCSGISGWSIIVHAHPRDASEIDTPPTSWIGDTILIGSFTNNVDANYDGKYFRNPNDGQLYLIYQSQYSKHPNKRDGVVAWQMSDPKTLKPAGSEWPQFLLLPDEDLNSEDYVRGNSSFRLIETGNIRLINGVFVMVYSVGAYNRQTYKIGVAYSDTFLPSSDNGNENGKQQYRKVLKNNPDNLWGSGKDNKEVFYLLQAEESHEGWHYVANQVLAPGVPTAAQIGADNGGWVLLFAGYEPGDTGHGNDGGDGDGDGDIEEAEVEAEEEGEEKTTGEKFQASKRRPFFVGLNVSVPQGKTVKEASDEEVQGWITPLHG